MSAFTDNPSVCVMMTPELVEQLEEWSESVQLKVVRTPGVGTGYELTARRIECPNFTCPVAAGRGEEVL